jgi:hypothetical protein
MPYGVDKDQGGDDSKNTEWMEKCVTSVMDRTGKDKSSAIAICKAQLKKQKSKANLDSFELDAEILEWFDTTKISYINRLMMGGKTFQQASSQFEADLAKGKVFNL